MRRLGAGKLFVRVAAAAILALAGFRLPDLVSARIAASHDPAQTVAHVQSDVSGTAREYLIGVFADPPDESTPRMLGAAWDYTINYSYQDNCRGCGVSGLARLGHYPVIIDLQHVQSTYPDFSVAADGGYDDDYRHTARQLVPYADQIYAVRIDSEFNGAWSAASAFAGGRAIAPSTWIAGFRRLAFAVRTALPGARIVWNPNIGQHDPFPYYPGDDVVDLIGPDIYCQPAYSSTSADCWDKVLHGPRLSNLDVYAIFAKTHDKPIIIPEWGDSFGDGTLIGHMREWMDRNHVVAQSYWDSGEALSRTASLSCLTVNQRAYVDAFGHRPYAGKYWPLVLPVPGNLRNASTTTLK